MLSKMLTGALGAGIFALGAATSAQAANIPVNDAGNSGPGTLRAAINTANNTPAVEDTIKFAIPGTGVHTITPLTPLPTITAPVKINGYTQTDADPADVSPATLKIVIDAGNVDDGLVIEADGVTVKGLDIQSALREGVHIEGSDNIIAGNYIGTGVNGDAARPNDLEGVRVLRGDGNLIGGPDAADRNVISSSGFAEVLVDEGTGNTVQNNHIGTDVDGTTDLGNGRGVQLQLQASGNVVRDNLVSGESTGVEVDGDDNVVQGNKIGTDADGSAALPNVVGVEVFGDGNEIGGTADGEGNLVSGNEHSGVELRRSGVGDPAERNKIEGNLIGTTAAGDAPLPNGEAGVTVSGSGSNTIGGTAAGAGNVIAGNAGAGVELEDADGNEVLGNWIGTDATGALDLGNGGSGVEIDGDTNRVGDTGSAAANTIAHNGADGVTVDSGTGNAVLRNSIDDNTGLAIDLADDGPTSNDADDLDSGANDLQNGPEIQSAETTSVEWSLDSETTTKYRLEFYANDTCSGASVTEAQTFLGSTTVTTDANGHKEDGTPITLPAGAGPYVSMTATRLQRVLTGLFPATFTQAPRSTSEVSPSEEIS
jgi:hypothetical protein